LAQNWTLWLIFAYSLGSMNELQKPNGLGSTLVPNMTLRLTV